MKRLMAVIAVVALTVFAAASAYADIDLGGYTGKLFVKLTGYANTGYGNEQAPDEIDNSGTYVGSDNWGVGYVSGIYKLQDNGVKGAQLWADGQGGSSLGFMYYGAYDFDTESFPIDSGSGLSTYAADGALELYRLNAGSINFNTLNTSQRTDFDQFTNITDGTAIARFWLTPGIVDGDDTTTLSQNLYFDQDGNGVAGDGAALALNDIAFGEMAGQFVNGQFKNGTDLSMGYTLSAADANNGFQWSIDDPIKTAVAPEPVSSALFLFGGAALAARQLRRKNKKA